MSDFERSLKNQESAGSKRKGGTTMSTKTANDFNAPVGLSLDVLFPIFLAVVSTIMVAYPVWNPVVILTAFVISAIVYCGFFYGMIFILIPKDGFVGSCAKGLIEMQLLLFPVLLLFAEAAIVSKFHHWQMICA